MTMTHWVSIWGQSHTNIAANPVNPARRTARFWILSALAGTKIRICFQNKLVEKGFAIGEGAVTAGGRSFPITFGGAASAGLASGASLYSDEIECAVKPGDLIEVRLYYPEKQNPYTGNVLRERSSVSVKGNFVQSGEFPQDGRMILTRLIEVVGWNAAISSVFSIEVLAEDHASALVIFGDSITQQCRWTKPLEQRLAREYPGEVALVNQGISGNRLLRDGLFAPYGEAGVRRFVHDVFSNPGTRTVVFALGTNDIGLPGGFKCPASDLPTVEEYTTAVEKLVHEAHVRGVRFVATTIAPRSISKLAGDYSLERERLRVEINRWIKGAGIFDAVLDFDGILQNPYGIGMRPDFDSGDGIHPGENGGLFMANSIDLRDLVG